MSITTPPQTPPIVPASTGLPENATSLPPPIQVLFNDGNVKIEKVRELKTDQGITFVMRDEVRITTTDRADQITIHAGANGQVNARINGKLYELPITRGDIDQTLVINSLGGDDNISIDPDINVAVEVHAGDGNDHISAGGGITKVFAGKGNDVVLMGSGNGVAFGEDGDDLMFAGTGNAMMSGGKGRDKLSASQGPEGRMLYLSGDEGDDELRAGDGKVILNGGLGNDKLVGFRRTTIYTGNGEDTVHSGDSGDLIYAKKTDSINNHKGAKVTEVRPSDAGKRGFKIEGSPDFISRIENKIEELRGSPTGQKLLEEMDRLADKIGSPVLIRKPFEVFQNDAYWFDSEFVETYEDGKEDEDEDHQPKYGYIKDGVPGTPASRAVITIESSEYEDTQGLSPLLTLFHEMIHAYNGATGTKIPGQQPKMDADGNPVVYDGKPRRDRFTELQAIGIPNSGEPFDFDNDPTTPPTTMNPYPFYENALRRELGVPIRKQH